MRLKVIMLITLLILLCSCEPADDYKIRRKDDGSTVAVSQKPIGDQDGLIAQLKAQTLTIKLFPYVVKAKKGESTEFLVAVRNVFDHEALYTVTVRCLDAQGIEEDFHVPVSNIKLAANGVSHAAIPVIPGPIAKNEIYPCEVMASAEGVVMTDKLFIQVLP